MNITVAPDKFKGTLTAVEAAELIARAFHAILPEDTIRCFPLADGGEGTCRALTAARNGVYHRVAVRGPLGEERMAEYGLSGKTAFMEMAACSGLQLVPTERRNPRRTSTYGFGQMIRDAILRGAETIVAGIGGSATNDGGAGMAEALGARFYGHDGNELHGLCGDMLGAVDRIDLTELKKTLAGVHLIIASDVTNPLLGSQGTAEVYSRQKGAASDDVAFLEASMSHFYRIADTGNALPLGCPGDGAAGGLGFGFRVFCNADFESGARLVIRETGLENVLRNGGTDLVITGEGCTDSQTEAGKLCAELACLARKNGIPCFLLSGSVGCPPSALQTLFNGVFVSGLGRKNLEETLAHAAEDLEAAARSLAAAIAAGKGK